jgi:thiol-disulfide isomerase/thioredoxin
MAQTPNRPPYTSLAVLAAVFAIGFVWFHAGRSPSSDAGATSRRASPFQKHGTLQDFAFKAEGDRSIRLSDFRGRPVLLNLWATWCAPCVEEMPSLDRLQRDFPGVAVVAISLDREGEAKVREFFTEHGLDHLKIYTDTRMSTMARLGAPGLPFTMLIDANGREAGSLSGSYDWDAPEARAAVGALLKPELEEDAGEPISVRNRVPEPVRGSILDVSHRSLR